MSATIGQHQKKKEAIPAVIPLASVKLIFCPRSKPSDGSSHTGLFVSVQGTARVLRNSGVNAYVRPVLTRPEIETLIVQDQPSHIVVSALWLPTADLTWLAQTHPHIQFCVLCHSNIAFLQAEPNAITLLREAVDLELSSLGNFQVAANSANGAAGIADAWECPSIYLPNLYYLDDTVRVLRRKWSGGTLRIGAFGAIRPLKNPTASAFAALAIATTLSTNLDFYMNTNRNDQGWAQRLVPAVEAIFRNLPYAKLIKLPWLGWPDFRRQVRGMHLCLQPSFTETFNIVSADAVAEGIPSVVSNVIEWAPPHWKADPDDTEAIARAGRQLLADDHAALDGLNSLKKHNTSGVILWHHWLMSKLI
jgi:hypothetical protein